MIKKVMTPILTHSCVNEKQRSEMDSMEMRFLKAGITSMVWSRCKNGRREKIFDAKEIERTKKGGLKKT